MAAWSHDNSRDLSVGSVVSVGVISVVVSVAVSAAAMFPMTSHDKSRDFHFSQIFLCDCSRDVLQCC